MRSTTRQASRSPHREEPNLSASGTPSRRRRQSTPIARPREAWRSWVATSELELIRERLQVTATERRVRLSTIVGTPGIGKTRLLREAMRAAEGFRWLQGRSIPYGDGVAYWSLAEIVKTVAGILDTDAPAQAARKLRRAVRETVTEDPDTVEEQLRVLLGVESRELSSARPAAFAAWHRFLVGLAAQQPLVLALEDIHWADDGLLDFIEHLRATPIASPLLVVCTARPELLERRPGWAPVVELSPLSPDDTRTLLSVLAGIESLPDELEAVVSGSVGTPSSPRSTSARSPKGRPATCSSRIPFTR